MSHTEFTVIIPARYASTRLPGKALLDLCGKPLVQHVYERAMESGAARVIVATDDDRIARIAATFGADVEMTSPAHASGTDRLAEVVSRRSLNDAAVVVNLQGDEPMMSAAVIRQVAGLMQSHHSCMMATVCERIESPADVFDPNIVKVVMSNGGEALYFSRAPVPWARDSFADANRRSLPETQRFYRHIGLYAYRAGFLRAFTRLPPTDLEKIEALEQLRALQHGYRIAVAEACAATGFGVDTPADLDRVRQLMTGTPHAS
ncbi:MAG: 3-deoxy-manno-octulosonate cytidylyltransferase [Gammaproteobacteria bacterium]